MAGETPAASVASASMNARTQDNWLTRNWKWFVPVGCLTMLVLFLGGIAMIAWFAFAMMKQSDVYADAVAQARAHPAAIEALGTPIEEGLFVSGQINVTGPSGDADLAVPLSGPKGKATLYIVASKSAGQWRFSTLQLQPDAGAARIDLLEKR
jgi:hypothetical protein